MKKVFTTAFIAMLSLSAFAQTKADTLVVTTTPKMHCERSQRDRFLWPNIPHR